MLLFLIDGFCQVAFWFTLMLYLYHLDMSLISIGFVAAIGTIASALLYIPAGIIADKVGRKRVLLVGTFLAAVAVALFLLKPNILILTFASLLNGVAMAVMQPAQSAFLSEKTSREKRKFLFSITASIRQFGSAISLLLIILFAAFSSDMPISKTATFQLFYLTYAIAYIIKIFICIAIPEKYDHKLARGRIIPKSWPIFLKFGIVNLIIGIGAGIMVPWFPVFFKMKFQTTLLVLAIVFFINAVVWTVSVLVIPLFADRFGTIRTIVVAQGAAIFVIVLIPNSPFFLMAAVFFIIRIVLMNIAVPITQAFQFNLVKEEERGRFSGSLQTSWLLVQGIGTFIGGFLFSYLPISTPFYTTATIYVVYIFVFWLFFHKMEKKGSGR